MNAQDGYGNQWIFGRNGFPPYLSGALLDFNGDSLQVTGLNKPMQLEASCAIMCDAAGQLLFYSNGCYIANASHQMMVNGDSIGQGYLATSFCNGGGNPITQGIIALPKPNSDHLYYLFYTDFQSTYEYPSGLYFPLAPLTLYYAIIDMQLDNGRGAVVQKNQVVVQDTLARGLIQAQRHANSQDWWIVMPESHSNCYYTLLLTENGIDTVFKQCVGHIWGDEDPTGQAVFSPNSLQYARFNYFYGLNIFDFDDSTGLFFHPLHIDFGQDTFYWAGGAFSSNSRFFYACATRRLWQFDLWASDVSASRILIDTVTAPPDMGYKARFIAARLAPDGKIYIASNSQNAYLHTIHRPNCYGLACDLQQYAVKMPTLNTYTMVNMPHYKHWSESDTCETVGVKVVKGESREIKVYPNPTSGTLWLSVPSIAGEPLQLDIFDLLGRKVYSRLIHQSKSEIDITGLKSRAYYYVLYSKNILAKGKIIKTE